VSHKIGVIPGDGIGPDVVGAAVDVLRATGVDLETTTFDLGADRFLRDGHVLDDADLEAIRGCDAILKGPLGPAIGETRIPGGTHLLSKRPEMFLPDRWPSYYASAKGCEVTDLDGNRYIDMTIMGMGACVLGYADPDVDDAVRRTIDNGVACTLNAPEEVELADLLCELHPWADKVRYARGGGEILSVAIRVARAVEQSAGVSARCRCVGQQSLQRRLVRQAVTSPLRRGRQPRLADRQGGDQNAADREDQGGRQGKQNSTLHSASPRN
jgi:hypothetical protein